jgi:hypothetical protein
MSIEEARMLQNAKYVYADAPAGALLTGLGVGEWAALRSA